jgi:hypothetical protein
MAGSPRFKVHNPQGEYVASCKQIEDAAMICGGYGDGAKIKDKFYGLVWHEGHEATEASESYDTVATVVFQRIEERYQAAQAKHAARYGGR